MKKRNKKRDFLKTVHKVFHAVHGHTNRWFEKKRANRALLNGDSVGQKKFLRTSRKAGAALESGQLVAE